MTEEKRDNYWAMMKEGKYRAFRNLPVGWVLQIIHSTDKTERWFRIVCEITILSAVYFLLISADIVSESWFTFLVTFIVVHSLSWFLVGNFWVYMLDSFKWVKNPGIDGTIKYLNFVNLVYRKVDCCDAVLVYGSMCRSMFHGRSDLDLRIIRRTDSIKGLLAIPIGFFLRAYSFFIIMPVDFQVVDSIDFIKNQMRDDEYPIVVLKRKTFYLDNLGMTFESVAKDSSVVLKEYQIQNKV